MTIAGWIILGGLAGWIAAMLMREEQSCCGAVIVGIIGAVVGGALFSIIGGVGVTGFNLWSLIVSVIGAVLFLGLLRALRGRR